MEQPPNVCEEKTFSEIFKSLSRSIRDYLYFMSGDIKLSEDLVQDIFVKLWNKCKEVPPSKARAFLFAIAKNEFLGQVEKKKVRLRYKSSIVEQKEKEDPHFQLEAEEFKKRLEDAIEALPEGQREVFLMNRMQEMTYAQIAESLGVSQKAVEKRMSKALKKMRNLLHPKKSV
ncbi:MAG: RNA polymerase sigma-70 factor [Bacteroidota bacterium]